MHLRSLILILGIIFYVQLLNGQDKPTSSSIIIGGSLNFFSQNNTFPYTNSTLVSGSGGIYSNRPNKIKNLSFAITPYIGKEISPHWILGIQLDYRMGRYKGESTTGLLPISIFDFKRNSDQIGVGLIARYIINPTKKFNFYLQPFLDYNFRKEKESGDPSINQEEKIKYIESGLELGVSYNINKRWRAILKTGGFSYVNGSWEVIGRNDKDNFSSFQSNLNLSSIGFGIEVRL